MITKHDLARRQTCADTTITYVIRQTLTDNFGNGFKSLEMSFWLVYFPFFMPFGFQHNR